MTLMRQYRRERQPWRDASTRSAARRSGTGRLTPSTTWRWRPSIPSSGSRSCEASGSSGSIRSSWRLPRPTPRCSSPRRCSDASAGIPRTTCPRPSWRKPSPRVTSATGSSTGRGWRPTDGIRRSRHASIPRISSWASAATTSTCTKGSRIRPIADSGCTRSAWRWRCATISRTGSRDWSPMSSPTISTRWNRPCGWATRCSARSTWWRSSGARSRAPAGAVSGSAFRSSPSAGRAPPRSGYDPSL